MTKGKIKNDFFCFLNKNSLEFSNKGICLVNVQLTKQIPKISNKAKNHQVVYTWSRPKKEITCQLIKP